ncbi:MAG: FHA domain-containing protein [Acidimicrobiales bacterium]
MSFASTTRPDQQRSSSHLDGLADEAPPVDLRAIPDPAPVATKFCSHRHPNNADSSTCRVCNETFTGAADMVAIRPLAVGRLLLEDGTAVDVADDLLIGRSPTGDGRSCTLTVTGRQVSRRHLLIEARGWQLYVRDCDSTNGTFIARQHERGRRRVPVDHAVPVHAGDIIHFGSRHALVVPATTG